MRSTQSSAGGPPSGLASLLAGLRQAELVITTSAFVVLAVVIFADVVMRRVTGSGLVWAREVGVLANVVLTIIGIGLASADGTHLRPRLLDHIFPASWDAGMTRVQELLTALAFAALAWIAMTVVLETVELDDRSVVLRWVLWPVQACLPLAFAVAALRHGVYAWRISLRPRERGEGDVA